jgi:hypothetical protein
VQVSVKVAGGPASGQSVSVSTGQVVKIGRADSADFSVPGDSQMSAVHFSLTCDSRNCHLRAMDEGGDTLVNGQRVVRAVLKDGDRITAGATSFSISAGGGETQRQAAAAPAPASSPVAPPAVSAPPAQGPRTTAELCADLRIGEEAERLLESDPSPREFQETLIARELFPDAIRFLAYRLPKPKAIAWAVRCLHKVSAELPAGEAAALEAVERWLGDASDENRRAAQAAAEAAQFEGGASWVAMAVFWSGGSMAPPDQAAVPPPAGLTAEAVSAALTIAAIGDEPKLAPDVNRAFLADGLEDVRD